MARLTPAQMRAAVRNATREARRAGSRARSGGLFQTLGAKFGAFGELVGMLGDILAGGKRPTRTNIADAVQILSEQGFPVAPTPPGEVLAPPVIRPVRGVQPVAPVAQPGVGEAAEPWPEERSIGILPHRILGAGETVPAGVEGFSPWLYFPNSSNLHAALYDYDRQVLYLQFRAPGKPIGYKDGISLCTGKEYKIAIRPDVPGPIYSYGGAGRGVPPEVFNQLVSARSAGKVVWDKLRVCGSQWQHKYVYSLVDVPQGGSVPRRATRRGLRVRSVPTVGLGRRGYRQSTLPERVR